MMRNINRDYPDKIVNKLSFGIVKTSGDGS